MSHRLSCIPQFAAQLALAAPLGGLRGRAASESVEIPVVREAAGVAVGVVDAFVEGVALRAVGGTLYGAVTGRCAPAEDSMEILGAAVRDPVEFWSDAQFELSGAGWKP